MGVKIIYIVMKQGAFVSVQWGVKMENVFSAKKATFISIFIQSIQIVKVSDSFGDGFEGFIIEFYLTVFYANITPLWALFTLCIVFISGAPHGHVEWYGELGQFWRGYDCLMSRYSVQSQWAHDVATTS